VFHFVAPRGLDELILIGKAMLGGVAEYPPDVAKTAAA